MTAGLNAHARPATGKNRVVEEVEVPVAYISSSVRLPPEISVSPRTRNGPIGWKVGSGAPPLKPARLLVRRTNTPKAPTKGRQVTHGTVPATGGTSAYPRPTSGVRSGWHPRPVPTAGWPTQAASSGYRTPGRVRRPAQRYRHRGRFLPAPAIVNPQYPVTVWPVRGLDSDVEVEAKQHERPEEHSQDEG